MVNDIRLQVIQFCGILSSVVYLNHVITIYNQHAPVTVLYKFRREGLKHIFTRTLRLIVFYTLALYIISLIDN